MKGYKVTGKNRIRLFGIACDSLNQLLEKGRKKLGISEEVFAALDDGTIVDDEDYFLALPSQTIFVLYKKNENILTGVDFVLNVLRRVNGQYLQIGSKANHVLLDKTQELMEILKENKNNDYSKSTREEDPEWFSELETNAQSKDDYMHRKSQDRIRGYFYKFQEDVRKSKVYTGDPNFRKVIHNCIEFFKIRLKSDGYFGCYFDRRCAIERKSKEVLELPKKRFKTENLTDFDKVKAEECRSYDKFSYCDVLGNFVCQGRWKVEQCEFVNEHQINPYLSREARIIFSTWNLDHRIEKSRSIAPALLKAIESCEKFKSVNFLYFYELLFTKINLKLVHIVCHDKSIHDVICDSRFLYI